MDAPHPPDQTPTPEPDYEWTPRRIAIAFVAIALIVGMSVYYVRDQRATAGPGGGPRATPGETFDLSNLQIDESLILSGGPPPDGIPGLRTEAAEQPDSAKPSPNPAPHPARIVPADEANVQPDSRVVGVEINGEARAYPFAILNYHELVNDKLGDVPICVIYCPLCDSVSVVDRRIDGDVLEFGTSGLLTNSNVLFYDRRDMALWSQVRLTAISGPLAGQSLKHLDGWRITTFDAWRSEHPETTVLARETGYQRDYRRSPYAGYFGVDELMFDVAHRDRRMPNKTPVIGVQHGDVTRAYVVKAIDGVMEDTIGGQTLRLERDGDGVHVAAAPDDANIVHTFWFAWVAFHPDTKVVGLDAVERQPVMNPAASQPTSQPATR